MKRPPNRTVSKNCQYRICGQAIDNMTERQVVLLGGRETEPKPFKGFSSMTVDRNKILGQTFGQANFN